jgi:hypothetical protein
MFFANLTVFMQEFVLSFSGSQPITFHAAVIFMNHKILQRTHALLDSLKELLLIRNIMTFVDTQQHFVVTQNTFFCLLLHKTFCASDVCCYTKHFAVTQNFLHLDVCCYTETFYTMFVDT